jgi:hypothetical protein
MIAALSPRATSCQVTGFAHFVYPCRHSKILPEANLATFWGHPGEAAPIRVDLSVDPTTRQIKSRLLMPSVVPVHEFNMALSRIDVIA